MFDPRKCVCPYTGLSKTCAKAREKHECPKWVSLMVESPTTGEKMAEWACADFWAPIQLAAIANQIAQRMLAVQNASEHVREQSARAATALERIAAATPVAAPALHEPPPRPAIAPPIET